MSSSSNGDGNARSLPLSVLIPVRNEAQNIDACLRSVAFADDIVVVDSQSTDGTGEMALACGARVVQFHWNGQYPKKKNWALTNIDWKHDWLLIVDADERITPELQAEIATAIESSEFAGYYLNRRFMFMGKWIRHCGYYPSWNLRLFRHERGRYERLESVGDTGSGDNEVHEHVVLRGAAGRLRNDMLHYAYPSVSVWIEKHNRYSNWEACVAQSRIREGSSSKVFDSFRSCTVMGQRAHGTSIPS